MKSFKMKLFNSNSFIIDLFIPGLLLVEERPNKLKKFKLNVDCRLTFYRCYQNLKRCNL